MRPLPTTVVFKVIFHKFTLELKVIIRTFTNLFAIGLGACQTYIASFGIPSSENALAAYILRWHARSCIYSNGVYFSSLTSAAM